MQQRRELGEWLALLAIVAVLSSVIWGMFNQYNPFWGPRTDLNQLGGHVIEFVGSAVILWAIYEFGRWSERNRKN